jgi:hypothetical protein
VTDDTGPLSPGAQLYVTMDRSFGGLLGRTHDGPRRVETLSLGVRRDADQEQSDSKIWSDSQDEQIWREQSGLEVYRIDENTPNSKSGDSPKVDCVKHSCNRHGREGQIGCRQ